MNIKAQTVDEYLELAPKAAQAYAKRLRALITKAAPQAEEKISYSMPYYHYKGRLIYWAAAKDYVAVYVMSGAREALADECEPYQATETALHFPLDRPLPEALITKIVKTEVAAKDAKGSAPDADDNAYKH